MIDDITKLQGEQETIYLCQVVDGTPQYMLKERVGERSIAQVVEQMQLIQRAYEIQFPSKLYSLAVSPDLITRIADEGLQEISKVERMVA